MSNHTSSPTNLSAELESSTETTNHPRDKMNSEFPSAIRHNEDNSFSPNLGFNSPTIEQSNEMEDSTARLKQIRDELVQQVRDKENELIQQEMNELQNSLDRRHRRGSDHCLTLSRIQWNCISMLFVRRGVTVSDAMPTAQALSQKIVVAGCG